MENYFKIGDKKIEMSQGTADNILEASQEAMYSIGDRFVFKGKTKYILAIQNTSKVFLVNLGNGLRWSDGVTVKNMHKIDKEEFKRITLGMNANDFTRYRDSQKKVETDVTD